MLRTFVSSPPRAVVTELLIVCHVLASLTDEEIAAIDEAGAKGPPKALTSYIRRSDVRTKLVWAGFVLQILFLFHFV